MAASTGKYFNILHLTKEIWSIAGMGNEQMYLVAGSEKAMLVDTGLGIGDLAGEVHKMTELPVIVVNTHGHPDHAGGNSNFKEVWLPRKDLEIMLTMCTTVYRLNDIRVANEAVNPDYQRMIDGVIETHPFDQKYLEPGQVIDLGGMQYVILDVPGHTPGSICLVNYRDQIIFTGDTVVATPVWLYMKHSLPLHVYYNSLLKLDRLGFKEMTIYPGHPPAPLGSDQLRNLIACCEDIRKNPRGGVFTKTFAGEGYQWTHESGAIIYNPDNL